LYHLGLALPPHEGLAALEEALLHHQGDKKVEARLSIAMTHIMRKLGRFSEALAYANLAVMRGGGAYAQMQLLTLELLCGERSLSTLEQDFQRLLKHESRGIKLGAMWGLIWLYQAQEKALASDLLRDLLDLLPMEGLPWALPTAILLFKEQQRVEDVHRLLKAARLAEKFGVLHRALCNLGEGLWYYPARADTAPRLRSALPVLKGELFEEALRAQAYLSAFEKSPLPEPFSTLARQLRPEIRPIFLPQGLRTSFYLQVLGDKKVSGKTKVRLRSLELLVLLISRPQGWHASTLARHLYGDANLNALKVEISRLRKLGVVITAHPYQLHTPVSADLLDIQTALKQNDLAGAVTLYNGALLPHSQAPGIETLRAELEETLRKKILQTHDPQLLYTLAYKLKDDLELWEACLACLHPDDPQYPATNVTVQRLRTLYLQDGSML
jgi:hypothetical protein